MKRFVLTPAAKADLAEIAAFIGRDNPRAAGGVPAEIRNAMRRLASSPRMGHLRKDLIEEPVRFWPVYSYLILVPARNPATGNPPRAARGTGCPEHPPRGLTYPVSFVNRSYWPVIDSISTAACFVWRSSARQAW